MDRSRCQKDRFGKNFFLAILLTLRLSDILPEICWEDVAEEIFLSDFVLFEICDRGLLTKKPTHYLLK